ncbi:MAG: SGNH/GDSL hydrolase family protein [Phycisphaerae bacterium]
MAKRNHGRMVLVGAATLALVGIGCYAGRIQAAALPFQNMVVFGDSLSDNGNLLTIAPPLETYFPQYASEIASSLPDFANNYATGEFTDGAHTTPSTSVLGLWDEQFASQLGLPALVPALASNFIMNYELGDGYLLNSGGTNFAVAGSVSGNTITNSTTGTFQAGMATQLAAFKSQYTSGVIPSNSLYAFWGGANDILDAPSGSTSATLNTIATTAADNIYGYINNLASTGGKDFLWINLPPLGDTPEGAGNASALNAAAVDFNSEQNLDIGKVLATYPDVKVIKVNSYALFTQLVAKSNTDGFTNVTTPAQGLSGVNPNSYLFWDSLHPTTAADKLLAQAAAADTIAAVTPEPTTLLLLALGALAGLALRSRRQT